MSLTSAKIDRLTETAMSLVGKIAEVGAAQKQRLESLAKAIEFGE